MNKRISYFFILVIAFIFNQAQDLMFTNTQQSLVYLNPSFSGSNGYMRNQSSFRNQWPSGSFNSYLNSFDGYIKSIKGGVSLTALRDVQGRNTFVNNTISFAYAQYFGFMKDQFQIIPSIQFNFGQNKYTPNSIDPYGVILRRYGGIQINQDYAISKAYVDLSSGILLKYKNSFFGASFANLLQPNISLVGIYHLPVRTTIHASTNIKSFHQSTTNLFASFTTQNNHPTFQAKILMTVPGKISYGLGYQFINSYVYYNDAISANDYINFFVGLPMKKFTFMYSYTIAPFSDFAFKATAHELSLSFNFRKNSNEKVNSNLEN